MKNGGEMPSCVSCSELLVRTKPEECRCSHGRFDKRNPRWFAVSGIVKPNRTVARAQENCPLYRPGRGIAYDKVKYKLLTGCLKSPSYNTKGEVR